MSSRPPSSLVNDTEEQFDYDFFDDLPSLLDSEDELFLGIESSQMARSSQATAASSLGSSQPTHSTPNDTPESSNPAAIHQGVPLVLPNAPILHSQPPSGPGSQENSNEDNALNCEAAGTSSLGQCTGDFGGGSGILENGNPFDLCAPLQPEREIGRYYHYNPEDRSFVNHYQETFALPCPSESQPAATTASSNDDTPKPPPPAPKKKPSDSKERSKPAKHRKTVTRSHPKRRLSTIAPRPAVQATPTATNRSHMAPPPPTTPIAVLGNPRPLNGYSCGYDAHGSVSTQVQFNHGIMNSNMANNMGHPSMPQNASFVNGNGNSVNHGTIPQGLLHGVQNHSISQSINNGNIYRPPTPMLNNANDLMGGHINGPNTFAPCRSANTSRQHDFVFGGDDNPAPPDLYRSRRMARDMGTDRLGQYDRPSMGNNAAGLYHTSSPSSSPIRRQIYDTSQGTVLRGNIGWASPMPAPRESPGGNSTGGFSQPPAPGSSPMGSMGGASYMTTPGSFLMPHMSSSPPGPGSMSRREVDGRRDSDSIFLNDPAGANNTGQNGYHPYPYNHRRFQQDNRVYSKGKR